MHRYSPVQGQIGLFCPYTGDYGSVKTRILAPVFYSRIFYAVLSVECNASWEIPHTTVKLLITHHRYITKKQNN